jgi:hypothetical protein
MLWTVAGGDHGEPIDREAGIRRQG